MMRLSLTLVGLAFAGVAPAADWPEFRGPDGTGHYTGPPLVTAWGPDTNVTWKTPIPGLGWSSPIVVQGKIFLTTAVPSNDGKTPDYSLRALCLQADSGSIVWDREVFVESGGMSPRPHSKNSHASPTPVSDGQRIFVHFGHEGTACLDMAGNVVWKTQEHRYKPVHGGGGSPILVGDALVFSADGGDQQFLLALETKTGAVRWKKPRKTTARKTFSFSTPQVWTLNGQDVILSPASDFVSAHDPRDGQEVWRGVYPASGYSVIPRPILAGGRLIVSTSYDTAHLVAYDPPGDNAKSATVAWFTKKDAPHTPTPLAVGNEIYMISDKGIMSCLDAKTGELHWSERLRGKGYSASPIHANGLIYFTSEDGMGQVIKASTEYQEVSQSGMKERTFATPAAMNGALFIRTESALYRFDKK